MKRPADRMAESARLADELAGLLGRFPRLPRGNLPSLEWATRAAEEATKDQATPLAGLRQAVLVLKLAAAGAGYTGPAAHRRIKPQHSGILLYEKSDQTAPAMLRGISNLARGEAGKGGRVNIERLGEFSRCFLEFHALGLPMPVEKILPAHMQVVSFVDALDRARFLGSANIAREDAQNLTGEDLTRLRKAARHTLVIVGELFTAAVS